MATQVQVTDFKGRPLWIRLQPRAHRAISLSHIHFAASPSLHSPRLWPHLQALAATLLQQPLPIHQPPPALVRNPVYFHARRGANSPRLTAPPTHAAPYLEAAPAGAPARPARPAHLHTTWGAAQTGSHGASTYLSRIQPHAISTQTKSTCFGTYTATYPILRGADSVATLSGRALPCRS
jgi:hypothetical protein